MLKSYPSSLLSFADMPEVSGINADFIYNFFLADESVNDKVDQKFLKLSQQTSRRKSKKDVSDSLTQNSLRQVPRYIRISFQPLKLFKTSKGNNEFISDERAQSVNKRNKISIQRHLSDVQSELDFSNGRFSGVFLQDSGADKKIGDIISSTFYSEGSLTDVAKEANKNTSDEVDGFYLSKLLNSSQSDIIYMSKDNLAAVSDDQFADVRSIVISSKINNKFIYDIAKTAAIDGGSIFSDEFHGILSSVKKIQSETIAQTNASVLTEDEYQTFIKPISVKEANGDSPAGAQYQVIGYIIEKNEIKTDGTIFSHMPIIIDNPDSSTYIDLAVKYGAVYSYKIKAVIQVGIQAISVNQTTNAQRVVESIFLISSQPSSSIIVKCEEKIPPKPPVDFEIRWDYDKGMPCLMWNFPINVQRDIKKFQVFRRKSSNEPFELIKMYDFDDSEVLAPYREDIDERLIVRTKPPVLYHYDDDFEKDQTYIYAICALDARNYTSNYSMQLNASFRQFDNKLVIGLFSPSNAPKQYPNIFIQKDLFVDTIRDSGSDQVRVYFDPEYLRVTKDTGYQQQDLDVIAFDEDSGKYRLQFLNLDLQKNRDVTFIIKDLRRS